MSTERRSLVASLTACLVSYPCLIQAQLADEGREKHENVAAVLAALLPEPGKRIADVGAGDGFYTVRIARAVAPTGRVTAVDVSESALGKLQSRLAREGITNVDVTQGAFESPRLADDSHDAALIYNSYHEMTEHAPMLRGIFAGLKRDGRLVIIEPIHDVRRGAERSAQTSKHEISDEITLGELKAVGFKAIGTMQRFDPSTILRVRVHGGSSWH